MRVIFIDNLGFCRTVPILKCAFQWGGSWLITMGDNTGSFIRFAQLLARICHLHDGQLRDTHMCHVGDKLSCNAVYRTLIVMQKAHVGQL